MVSIHRRPSWAIDESQATPEHIFLNRRAILQGLGLGLASAGLAGSARSARAQEADPTADLYPATPNDAYKIERPVTPQLGLSATGGAGAPIGALSATGRAWAQTGSARSACGGGGLAVDRP